MKQRLRDIHRDQRGLAIAAALALMLIIAAISGGLWQARSFLHWAEEQNSTVITLPDRAEGYEWRMLSCVEGDGGNDLNGRRGIIVTMPYTMELREFDWRIGKTGGGGDKVYWIEVWEQDGGCIDIFLGGSYLVPWASLMTTTGYPALQPWNTFTFAPQTIYLYEGSTYVLFLDYYSGSTGDAYTMQASGTDCIGSIILGYYSSGGNCYYNADMDFAIRGYVSASPEVYTLGYELNLDGSIQLYGAADVIGDMTCGFLVSDDYDTVVSGSGTQYESGTSGWNAGRYLFDYRLAFLNNDLQYSYAAYASAYGQTWYGDVYNFTRSSSDIPFTLGCDVIENSPDRVWFESSVVGINASGSTTYNLTIAYGTNQTGCQASNGTIAVAYNVTADGIWRTEVNPVTEFDEGTRYYYRLAVAGNDSSLAHSRIQSFTTWDSDQPPWLQRIVFWINDTVGGHLTLDSAWWWIVLVLLLAAWTLAGVLKWKWVGVIGTGAIFMWLVVTGRVPVWVVILAVLLAGWIIFKLVFTRAHEETGD